LKIIDCECGDQAVPSNFSFEGVGRLWYCFNCCRYLNEDGKYQDLHREDDKYGQSIIVKGTLIKQY